MPLCRLFQAFSVSVSSLTTGVWRPLRGIKYLLFDSSIFPLNTYLRV